MRHLVKNLFLIAGLIAAGISVYIHITTGQITKSWIIAQLVGISNGIFLAEWADGSKK